MTLNDILFYQDSRIINQFEPLCSQCSSNARLLLRRKFTYKIVWKGRRTQFRYLTNSTYSKFISRFLTYHKIPQNEFSKYSLQIGGQPVNPSFMFPINGIPEDIYILDNQGLSFSQYVI